MRLIASALMLAAGLAMAAEPLTRFDQAQFEKRFRQADKGKKGKLTRAEAYAEFPGMPQYFDEIDRNSDGFITLDEVKRAMERRVDAAITAGRTGRYGSSATLGAGSATPGAGSATPDAGSATPGASAAATANATPEEQPQFSSKAEARRYYRHEYYESVAGSNEKARQRGEPISDSPPTFLKKSF